MTSRTKLALYLVPLLALTVLAAGYARRAYVAERRAQAERAERQAVALERDGWQAAAEASKRELAETVPGLRAELEAAKAAGAPALLATRTTASAHWSVDRAKLCRETSPGSDAVPPTNAPSASADTPGSGEDSYQKDGVDVDLKLETAVTADELGRIYTVTKAWGTVRLWGFELERQEFAVGKESTTTVDPELTVALAAWRAPKPPRIAFAPRPFREWRAGWSCGAGGGVTHDGEAAAVVACIWGPQI